MPNYNDEILNHYGIEKTAAKPVPPKDFAKVQQTLQNAWTGYMGLLKKHDFYRVQTNHNFDKKLKKVYDGWDAIDQDIQGQVSNEWDRRAKTAAPRGKTEVVNPLWPGSRAGTANKKYLASIPKAKKDKILKFIAKHYGVSVREIEKEMVDPDAENLFEYAAANRAMAMEIYRDFKSQRLMG